MCGPEDGIDHAHVGHCVLNGQGSGLALGDGFAEAVAVHTPLIAGGKPDLIDGLPGRARAVIDLIQAWAPLLKRDILVERISQMELAVCVSSHLAVRTANRGGLGVRSPLDR
jgi:hypothetical protein